VWAEVICGEKRRIKPVRCVCGELIDATGGLVRGAKVTVIKDGTALAIMKTAGDGRFTFDELKSGRYELKAQLDGFETFQSPIEPVNPAKKNRRGLVIFLKLPYPDNCGSEVVKQ
jgi:Carboxypeptidase regulatory-like domain